MHAHTSRPVVSKTVRHWLQSSREIAPFDAWVLGFLGPHFSANLDCPVSARSERCRKAAEETPVEQLDPGAGKTKRAYLFAYRSASAPLVVFDYCSSRSGKNAQRFLDDWRGHLMVDDFAGYKALFAKGASELACWAHARRKFVDLDKASGSLIAKEAIQRIAAIYRIDDQAREFDPDARHAHRQQHAAPLVDAFGQWLRDLHPKVLGSSGTARAIAYSLKRWPALRRYLDDGRFPIDNNPIENAIRPIALGRKNWLFAGSVQILTVQCLVVQCLVRRS